MKTKLFFALVVCASLLVSCGGGGKETNAPKEKTFAEKSYELVCELDSTYTHDGEEIELEGKFDIRMISMIRNNKFDVSFDIKSGNKSKSFSPVNITFGKTKNSLYFPDKAQSDEIEVYDQNGDQISYGKPVRIKGKLEYTSKGPKKKMSENKHLPESMRKTYKEREEKEGGDGMDYSHKLTNVTIIKLDSIK